MRRLSLLFAALVVLTTVLSGSGMANGPSGSKECHIDDDDCDGTIDEDTGTATDDLDGDGRIDEDSAGDTNGDGNFDDDLDGLIDEDEADDDDDGAVDEDAPGDALNDPGENQVDCNEDSSVADAPVNIYLGTNGAEVCDENSTTPIDGRVIVSSDGYVAIDGDGSNPGPSSGYARLDSDGPHCGDDANNQDSGADQSENNQDDCG